MCEPPPSPEPAAPDLADGPTLDRPTVEDQLFAAAKNGQSAALAALLDQHPEKLSVRDQPYEQSLLHLAATHGHLAAVELLLRRGLDVNTRDLGDNAYAMHFAAGCGHLPVVRRLADAGGDVIGQGDEHGLEVIGWATCFDLCHRAVAEFLVSRGARHHLFSALAMSLADEVRRIVAADPAALHRRMTRHEDHRLPLHHAARMKLPAMVALLLALGADPLATDGSAFSAAAYASEPRSGRLLAEATARRGGPLDLATVLILGDFETAARRWSESPASGAGALHLAAKQNQVEALRWLLARGADPNARGWHWDAELTPLHLAAAHGHTNVVHLLLAAGADPTVRDSKHQGDPLGWALHFGEQETARALREHGAKG